MANRRKIRRQRRRAKRIALRRQRRAKRIAARLKRRELRVAGRYDPAAVAARAEARGELWSAIGDTAGAVFGGGGGGAGEDDGSIGTPDDAALADYDDGADGGVNIGYIVGVVLVLFLVAVFMLGRK